MPAQFDSAAAERIKNRGFSNVRAALQGVHLSELSARCVDDLLESEDYPWSSQREWRLSNKYDPKLFSGERRDAILFDFLGLDREVDQSIKSFLDANGVLDLLASHYGERFRLWHAQLRCAVPDARGLMLHRDRDREVVVTLLLSDVLEKRGALMYVPKSHRWPRIIQPPIRVQGGLLGPTSEYATGTAGEGYIFDGRILHARRSPRYIRNLAVILSFLPWSSPWSSLRPIPRDVAQLFE